MKRSLVVLCTMCASALFLAAAPASGRLSNSAADRPVAKIALRASQVGPGYRAKMYPGGRKVQGQVTLDLCGSGYLSEALRTQRIQIGYLHPRGLVDVSNEVVRYRNRGGVELAYAELNSRVSSCPRTPVPSPVRGVGALTWRLTRISDPRLLRLSVAVRARVSGTVNGKRRVVETFAVYQVHGNVLSAVYTYGGTIAAQRRIVLRAAAASARNLRQS